MPQCDIIIPTHNSADVIGMTLEALAQQALPSSWTAHVICIDDGSTDRAKEDIHTWTQQSPVRVTLIEQQHAGSAAARNTGLTNSHGDVVLFLNDDVILQPAALATHCQFHELYPEVNNGALGWIGWDPRLAPSPYMEWMMHGGPQNNFDELLGVVAVDPHQNFLGGQVSVKRSLLDHERFSTDFIQYGWEDIEFGYRLAQRGLRLYFLEQARGLHRHYYTLADIRRRQYAVGFGSVTYMQLQPSTSQLPLPTIYTRIKYYLVTVTGIAALVEAILRYSSTRWSTPRLFTFFTAVHFWRGVFAAKVRKK